MSALTALRIHDSTMRIVPAARDREWMDATDQRFANRCLPLLIANQSAWWVLSNHDVMVTWSGTSARESISFASEGGLPHDAPQSHFGYGIVTWTLPFLFRTSPGFNLLVRGPANFPKDGIAALEGLVESDWSPATFTVNWKFTHACSVLFKKGDPICALVPQRRGDLEEVVPTIEPLSVHPQLQAEYETWARSRSAFNASLADEAVRADAPWQKDYFQGKSVTGVSAHEHQTKRSLRPFEETSKPE